ncbi:NAD(P)-binding protein [Francisella persica]|uniref:NAD(P)-binding protein n=1 Tax=Francisella persica TaxID=954 RepID=UPI000ADCD849|nr:NAD(P)-binding protein [Francisella persica]
MSKVTIIGAGASGIFSTKLLDKGFDVNIFEKTNIIACVWNYTEKGALYKSLRTNLPKK